MKSSLLFAVSAAALVVTSQACNSGNGTGGTGGGASTGTTTSTSSGSPTSTGTGTTTASSTSASSTTGTSSTTSASSTTTASSTSSGMMPCPDELGAYSVMITGAGCGDLMKTAPQCIKAGGVTCQVLLVSQGAGGAALNGSVDLDMNGGFSMGAIKEGTVQRTGCTGTWNAGASQLTVDCGGIGSSQSCIATLTRTGNTCP